MQKRDVSKKLKDYIADKFGPHQKAADKWGYSRPYITMMIRNPDLIPDKILKKIGIKRVKPESYYIEVRK